MNMVDTLKGSYFSEVLPEGWDISKIYDCVSNDLPSASARASGTMASVPSSARTLKSSAHTWVTKLPCRLGSPRKRAES